MRSGQCVDEASFDAVKRAGQESSLRVTGLVRAEPASPAAMNWPSSRSKWFAPPAITRSRPRSTGSISAQKSGSATCKACAPWASDASATPLSMHPTISNETALHSSTPHLQPPSQAKANRRCLEVDYFGSPDLSQTVIFISIRAMSSASLLLGPISAREEQNQTSLTNSGGRARKWRGSTSTACWTRTQNFFFSIARRVLGRKPSRLETLGADISAFEAIQKPLCG